MEPNHFVLIDIKIESTRGKLEHLQTESEITTRIRNKGNYVARDVSITIELPHNFISQNSARERVGIRKKEDVFNFRIR